MKTTNRTKLQNQIEFNVEPLESRLLLAGDVVAELAGRNLVIEGDDLDNRIEIDQVGLPSDQIRITGFPGTLVNGGTGPVVFDGFTGNLIIRMSDGDDRVDLDDATIAKSVIFDGGMGSDLLDIERTNFHQLVANKTVGNDSIDLTDSNVTTHVKVSSASGKADVSLDNTTVGKHLLIKNGDADDTITIADSQIDGNVKVDNGDGDNRFDFDGGNTISGNVLLKNSAGNDDVIFDNTNVAKNVKITNGNGGTDVRFLTNTSVAGNVTIVNGEGFNSTRFSATDVTKNVKISNGNGNSNTDVENGSNLSNLLITNRDGDDSMQLAMSNVANIQINNGKGGSDVVVENSSAIGQDLKIVNLNGDFDLTLTESTVVGNVHVLAGTGTSDIEFDTVNANNVSIQTGDQDDQLDIANLNLTGRFEIEMNLGVDTVVIEDSSFGSASFDGGEGNDILTYLAAGNTFVEAPFMVSFETVS